MRKVIGSKRSSRGWLQSWIHIPLPMAIALFPLVVYLQATCLFPSVVPAPWNRHDSGQIKATTLDKDVKQPVELGNLNNQNVKKIMLPSPKLDDNSQLFENKPGAVPTEGPLDAATMTFSIEDHGFQCLVHTSRARKFTSKETDVTWVTQFTVDRIEIFKQMLQRWTGPVSAAVYSQDVKSDLAQLTPLLDRCDLHIVGASQGLYPVNTLRNVAINNAHTDYLLLADVDFVPAAGVHEWLQLHLGELRAKAGDKAVFVLPAFEINGADQTVPLTKEKLKEMGPRIHQVHNDGGRDIAHKYTMYEQWNTATEAYPIEYKFPYEPYFVAPKHIPRYDVRFFGYGNDKASQCYEMNAAGFEYWVLPEHFVVHVAHKQGSWVSASFLDPKDRLSKTLGTFLKDVDSKYVRRASKNDKKVFEALPAAAAYEVAVSAPGASCTQACVEKGKQCKKEWAERINSCKELDLHFDCSKGCTDGFFGSDLPAYNLQREQCLINNAPEAAAFNCDIVYEFSKRVCPCGA